MAKKNISISSTGDSHVFTYDRGGPSVTATVTDGLIDFSLPSHLSEFLVMGLRKMIRYDSSEDVPDQDALFRIHRMSRMCWEAKTQNILTSLDSDDCNILYELPQEWQYEWIHDILNKTRSLIMKTGIDPVMADRYAKSVNVVMNA